MTRADSAAPRAVREVWLVRHGVTAANQDHVIQGQTDVELAPEGLEQARRLARHLADNDPGFTLAVTSPLARARRTAEIVLQAIDVELDVEPRFAEAAYGDWEGRSYDHVRAARAAAGGEPYEIVAPGGESVQGMGARALAAFDEWAAREDVGERLLVVTHGGPIIAVALRSLGLPHTLESAARHLSPNTGISVLERRAGAPGGFAVSSLGSTPHLENR